MPNYRTEAGTMFPETIVTEMFSKIVGHSALAKLSAQKPIPFSGAKEFVFTMDGKAQIVGEGGAKEKNDATVTTKVIRPVKFVYQHRVSDEFINASEEVRIQYLQAFADGFARKIAEGFDIAALHGVNPYDMSDASFKSTNSFDGLVTNLVTYAAGSVDSNIDSAVAMVQADGGKVSGIILGPTAASAMAQIKVNGVPQYPEYRFGQNPAAFYGMGSDVNATVEAANPGTVGATSRFAYVGDFQDAFRWGYAKNIPLEVIEYGDPDGQNRDLKRYNEVCLRAEAYIGWGILNEDCFAALKGA